MRLYHFCSLIAFTLITVTSQLYGSAVSSTSQDKHDSFYEAYAFEFVSGAYTEGNIINSGSLPKDSVVNITFVNSIVGLYVGQTITLSQLNSIHKAYMQSLTKPIITGKEYAIQDRLVMDEVVPTYKRAEGANATSYKMSFEGSGNQKAVKLLKKACYAAYEYASLFFALTVDFVTDILGISHKMSCGCKAYEYKEGNDRWNILVSTFSTGNNCNGASSIDNFKEGVEKCILAIKSEEGMTGYCCCIDGEGSWFADTRVCISGDGCNWDFPCAD